MKKGRNPQLIAERNQKIAEFYHQMDQQGLRTDVIVQTLCKTFYLSEYRIMAIIREMVKHGTFINNEQLLPIKRKREAPTHLHIQLELF